MLAVGLTILTGNPFFDALGSIGIGLLLIVIALMVGIQVKRLLIGQGVDSVTKQEIINFLLEQDEIKAFII